MGVNQWIGIVGTGLYKIYRVCDDPLCLEANYTKDHLEWACTKASGQTTPEEIADKIHTTLDADPPYEPSECEDEQILSDDWDLLDGCPYYGECDEQARFMVRVLKLLGLTGEEKLVRASTNSGAGNCLDFESRDPACPVHGSEKLLLDFYGGGTPTNMNQFEGCCKTAGHYYAVWPSAKATNDYTMLQALGSMGVTQHYCWWDNTIDWWQPCSEPNSTPAIP